MTGVLSPGIVSGLISATDCHFSPVSDRPVSGLFPCSVPGNPLLRSDGRTEVIPGDKTGLYRSVCFEVDLSGGLLYGEGRVTEGRAVSGIGFVNVVKK